MDYNTLYLFFMFIIFASCFNLAAFYLVVMAWRENKKNVEFIKSMYNKGD